MHVQARGLRVGDIMTRSPVVVGGHLNVPAAEEIALRLRVRHLLVSLPGGRLGAVCRQHLHSAPRVAPVGRFVCDPVWLGPLRPDVLIADALEIMAQRAFGCLPVMTGRLLLGVLTGGDLRRAGMPAQVASPTCASCGARFHVRSDPDLPGVAFCLACLNRVRINFPLEAIAARA
ncbi:MAG TPA: CBS domain-containing protein [Polyangia bacterium]|nr:CBS domain-containing protein [Polyangia bacterium]